MLFFDYEANIKVALDDLAATPSIVYSDTEQLQRFLTHEGMAHMSDRQMDDEASLGEIRYTPVALPDWVTLPPEKVKNLLKKVNEYIEPVPFEPPPATIGRVRQLPFYNDYYLLELTNLNTIPAYSKYALVKPGDIYVIDWTVNPIYDVNAKALQLDASNVVAYLEFFSEYVFTADGQRFIINSADDLPWLPNASDSQKDEAQSIIQPAQLTAAYEDGSFRVDVTDIALYDLYKSVVFVSPNGAVDWIIQDKLLENLEIQRRDLLV